MILLAASEKRLAAKQAASARNFGLAQVWLQLSTFATALVLAVTSETPTEILAVLTLMALGLNDVFASALEAFRQLPGLAAALDALPAAHRGTRARQPQASEPEREDDTADAESSAAPSRTVSARAGIDALELDGITVGWDEQAVLEGLQLQAERGSWTVLCGDSGTGKTTSLSVLLRFLDPWSGSYTARDSEGEGHDMLTRSPEDLVGQLAVVSGGSTCLPLHRARQPGAGPAEPAL